MIPSQLRKAKNKSEDVHYLSKWMPLTMVGVCHTSYVESKGLS